MFAKVRNAFKRIKQEYLPKAFPIAMDSTKPSIGTINSPVPIS